ncbi:MAG: helix-turn-helix transcriptional regulator [Nitrosospira sp.]
MRNILQSLLKRNNLTGHSLYEMSGVPPATTYRFLNGDIGEPRSGTVRKWAEALNVSEAQLRGTEPIDGLPVEKPENVPMTLASVLTRDELVIIKGMRALDTDMRRSWIKVNIALFNHAEAGSGKKAVPAHKRRRSKQLTLDITNNV